MVTFLILLAAALGMAVNAYVFGRPLWRRLRAWRQPPPEPQRHGRQQIRAELRRQAQTLARATGYNRALRRGAGRELGRRAYRRLGKSETTA